MSVLSSVTGEPDVGLPDERSAGRSDPRSRVRSRRFWAWADAVTNEMISSVRRNLICGPPRWETAAYPRPFRLWPARLADREWRCPGPATDHPPRRDGW